MIVPAAGTAFIVIMYCLYYRLQISDITSGRYIRLQIWNIIPTANIEPSMYIYWDPSKSTSCENYLLSIISSSVFHFLAIESPALWRFIEYLDLRTVKSLTTAKYPASGLYWIYLEFTSLGTFGSLRTWKQWLKLPLIGLTTTGRCSQQTDEITFEIYELEVDSLVENSMISVYVMAMRSFSLE